MEAGGLTKYDVKLITAGDGAATAHDGSGVAGGSVRASGAATTATKRKAAEQPASSVAAMAGSPAAKVTALLPPPPLPSCPFNLFSGSLSLLNSLKSCPSPQQHNWTASNKHALQSSSRSLKAHELACLLAAVIVFVADVCTLASHTTPYRSIFGFLVSASAIVNIHTQRVFFVAVAAPGLFCQPGT